MSRRVFFVVFYWICFFFSLFIAGMAYGGTARLDWLKATTVLNIIFGFGGVILVYWAYVDDDRLSRALSNIQ